MRHLRERALLAAVVLGVPLLFGLLVARPLFARIRGHRERFQAASRELETLPQFQPVTPAERAVLEDPAAPWRRRMPVLRDEQARLAHYHRVVSDLQGRWRAAGVPPLGVRSSWDPIRASFTLPGGVGPEALGAVPALDGPELKVQGWVLEARFGGPADALFRALVEVPQATPLLEPVGLRWEARPERRRQSLLLRNLVVQP